MELFIAGLVLSIPLSILANMYTEKVQLWLVRMSSSRTAVLEKELELVRKLRADRGELQVFLVARILRVTYISSISAILAGLLFASASLLEFGRFGFAFEISGDLLATIASSLGWLAAIIGGMAVVNQCGAALRVFGRVTRFPEFEKTVQERLKLRPA